MSTGYKPDSVFGGPVGQAGPAPTAASPSRASAPVPADATYTTKTVLPSDVAQGAGPVQGGGSGRKGRRGKERVENRERVAAGSSALFAADRASRRTKTVVVAVVLVALLIVSLFVDSGYRGFFDPAEVFACYRVAIEQLLASLFSSADVVPARDIVAEHPSYFRILNCANVALMSALCGAVLAIAGALYQSAFRNPIASPSMLGVSSAIQLGDVIMVLEFGALAAERVPERYAVCYTCVLVLMVVLFVSARLMSGRGRPFNVVNLLLVAMILNQLIGVLVTYATMYVFDWDQWEAYESLSESLAVHVDAVSWATLLVSCAVGLIPVLALRFRLNGLNFPDSDMRLLGINPSRMRIMALVCGTVLLMAAQVQMGTVAMLALVVPHVSRMIFGAEFRKSLAGDLLIGASMLVGCRIIVAFIPLVHTFLPVSVVVNFVVLPFFVWLIAVSQRSWS